MCHCHARYTAHAGAIHMVHEQAWEKTDLRKDTHVKQGGGMKKQLTRLRGVGKKKKKKGGSH